MRILHIDAGTGWTGRQAVLRALVEGAPADSQLVVVPPGSPLGATLQAGGHPVAELPMGGLLAGARRLGTVVREAAPDLVAAHGAESAAAVARVLGDRPMVVHLREGPKGRPAWLASARALVLGDAGLHSAWLDAGVSEDRIRVVPEGIDPSVAPDAEAAAALRKRWGVDSAHLLVGVVAATEGAGHHALIDAMARLARRRHDVAGVLVGAWGESRRLAARARRAGAPLYIAGTVAPEALPGVLGAVEVIVEPRAGGRVTRIVLEAAAAGVPLVTVLPADVLSEDCAIRVPPGDGKALADAIEDVLRHRQQAAVRARKAHAWVRDERSAAEMVRRTLALYPQILGSDAPPAP